MGRAGVFGALAVRQPVGVVTCITSYNNPWANPAGKVAPALAMGNTVVVKPAPQDPLSVYRMAEALAEAGVPPGVVNVVSGFGPRRPARRPSTRRTSTWSASPAPRPSGSASPRCAGAG